VEIGVEIEVRTEVGIEARLKRGQWWKQSGKWR